MRTLPVVVGARVARRLTQALVVLQLGGIALLVTFGGYPWLVLTGAALPAAVRLLRRLEREPPGERPAGFPADVWPLWYVACVFGYARVFGVSFAAGLALTVAGPAT